MIPDTLPPPDSAALVSSLYSSIWHIVTHSSYKPAGDYARRLIIQHLGQPPSVLLFCWVEN